MRMGSSPTGTSRRRTSSAGRVTRCSTALAENDHTRTLPGVVHRAGSRAFLQRAKGRACNHSASRSRTLRRSGEEFPSSSQYRRCDQRGVHLPVRSCATSPPQARRTTRSPSVQRGTGSRRVRHCRKRCVSPNRRHLSGAGVGRRGDVEGRSGGQVLRCLAFSRRRRPFARSGRKRWTVPSAGAGVAGRVWVSGQPVWLSS